MKTGEFLSATDGHRWKDVVFLCVVFGAVLFQGLGTHPLLDPDEGRYAGIAREMLESRDFVTPRLNYVKFFDKPPMHYWLSAMSMQAFGETEFAARLTSAICALFTVIFTYFTGRAIFGRLPALIGATVLGSSIGFIAQGRVNITDMTLTLFMTAAFWAACKMYDAKTVQKGLFLRLFCAFCALSVLTKGLIGLMPLVVIALYAVISKERVNGEKSALFGGILLFFAICLPWFVLVQIRNPEFAKFFFIHEHFERFLTGIHRREQAFWFFLPVLFVSMLPWSFFIPAGVREMWLKWRQNDSKITLLPVIWAGAILLFFSASSSKLITYILPAYPAIALILGNVLSSYCQNSLKHVKTAYFASFFLILCGIAAVLYPNFAPNPYISAQSGILLGGIFALGGIMAVFYAKKRRFWGIIGAFLAFSVAISVAGPVAVYPRLVEAQSAKELARIIKENSDTVFINYGYFEQGLSFYLGRRVIVAGMRTSNELYFGSLQGDGWFGHSGWFIGKERFIELWNSPARVLVLIRDKDLSRLPLERVNIISRKGRRVLAGNW